MKLILSLFLSAFTSLGAERPPRPGDGGDKDPHTFSFHNDSRVAPLANRAGKPLKNENVRTDYGREYVVSADGVDVCSVEYAWKLGHGGDQPVIQPKYQDLSKWESAFVENGWLAIDPATGRFKFARANRVDDPRRLEHRKQIVLGNLTMWQLVAKGKFAYTVEEEETHAFQAYDATDQKNFRYAGYSSMGGYPKAIALGEKHAYTTGSSLLAVHNIEDPHNCKYIKTFHNNGGSSHGSLVVDAETKRLYHRGGGGLMIYDISDEDDPVLVDLLKGLPTGAYKVRGNLIYGVVHRNREVQAKDKQGKPTTKKQKYGVMQIAEIAEDCHSFKLLGECEIGANPKVGSLSENGIYFVLTSSGLQSIDCRAPAKPKLLSTIKELAPVKEYWDKGPGGHDLDVQGNILYVASGRSKGGPTNPRNTGLFYDHVDFKKKVVSKKDELAKGKTYVGGLRIYDFSDPANLKLVNHLDDDLIGHDAITEVAVGDEVLFLGSRLVGVLAFDLKDPVNPKFFGRLANMGEVEWARLLGDKIYAVSNGVYVIEPYPAEEAHLQGWAFTHSWMFGHSVVLNPFPDYNPRKVLFARSGGWHRAVTAEDPKNPRVLNFKPPAVGDGRWVGPYLYTASARKNALEIYVVNPAGSAALLRNYPTDGPITHLEIHGNYVFGFGLVRGNPKPQKYLHIFDVTDPARAKLVATHTAPTDTGGMESPDVYYRDGFVFLPGWFAGGILAGQGWGNFPGIRVVDVRRPEEPKMHTLIHHIPKDISTNSLACIQSFHISGNTLFLGDYWSGIHVIDITGLEKKKKWEHIANVKDPWLPWSCSSYCTSVHGYGRYLYTTHFGHVNIWEISTGSDLPDGKLSVRSRPVPPKEEKKNAEGKKKGK